MTANNTCTRPAIHTPRTSACNCSGNRCRWMTGNDDAKARLLSGGFAPLHVHAANRSGHVDTFYLVEVVRDNDGQPVGYRLHREEGGKIVATYFIDIMYGIDSLDHWMCDCQAAGRYSVPCKHCKSLHAALSRIGLLGVN
jgi:hypothetical protein